MNEKQFGQRLRAFDAIIDRYDFAQPLARFLSAYYRENRQMGSRDRRIASRLVFNYFRLGKALPELPVHQRLGIAEFLCEQNNEFVSVLLPELADMSALALPQKIQVCAQRFGLDLKEVFPAADLISSGIDRDDFLRSHFEQPSFFIRIHKGKEKQVKAALQRAGYTAQELGPQSLSLPGGTKLDQLEEIAGLYEVQDYASQQVIELYRAEKGESWWDACAGSGGKSIPLMLEYPGVDLLVSDLRNTILRNLDLRFSRAGIKTYRRKIIDLLSGAEVLSGEQFDGIILDAPCSGSGTWGRSPEMLSHFLPAQLMQYSERQLAILKQVIPHLKPGKPLIYITCSVYEQENEQIVEALRRDMGMRLEQMHYFQSAPHRGDTLFAARLTR